MIRVILGGQFRGSQNNWKTIKNLIRNDFFMYVASNDPESWKPYPFHFQICKTVELQDTIFHKNFPHMDAHKYLMQWSSIVTCFNTFKDTFNEDDVIIKLRNDVFIENDCNLDLKTLRNDAIYVPSVEFHNCGIPFDRVNVCNDQIVLGKLEVMKKYFDLPYNYKILEKQVEFNKYGIEGALRDHIRYNNLELETFNLTYHRA